MHAAVASTRRPEVIGGLGGFASAMALPAGMREPVLVSSTDGVGTKTAIAMALGRYDTIGHDLVAMCADDLVCAGAEPLFFLDYVAVGRLYPETRGDDRCGRSRRAAALPAARSSAARRPSIRASWSPTSSTLPASASAWWSATGCWTVRRPLAGDALIGIASSGLHSNGYSLVRRIVATEGIDYGEGYAELLMRILGPETPPEPEWAGRTIGEVLLTPTRIYSKAILALRTRLDAAGHSLRGVAHITGGGLPGNVPRILPDGLGALVASARRGRCRR